MPGWVLRLPAEKKQGLEEEDLKELGSGESEVPGDQPGWECIAQRKAQGSFIRTHSTQRSGILRSERGGY